MLTVKKFGAHFNLTIGGYVAALLGLILAILTICEFPPDIDLAGKCWICWKFWLFFLICATFHKIDDEDNSIANATQAIIATTALPIIQGSTADPTPEDDDPEIPEEEKKDEINDSKFLWWRLLVFV